jgi:cell wall-associated NlpC family hydrolase
VANRLTRRVLLACAGLAVAVVCIPSVAGAVSAAKPTPPPTVASVQQQLGALALQNTQLVEQYDQAQVAVAAKRRAAVLAQRVAARAEAAYQAGRRQLAATLTAQYEGGTFSAAGALLSSQSGESYLNQLTMLSMISDHNAQTVAALVTVQANAAKAQQTAKTLLAQANKTLAQLGQRRAVVSAQVQRYTVLLGTLTATQRAAYLAAANPVASKPQVAVATATLAVRASSQAALTAVRFALSQVGKPYSYGSAGPYSYDCSGLTMRAWGAAGVSLPHSAEDQYSYGTHVPATVASLQPGDLVFFYQPIGHVTIYIGNGLMVSAPETGENVAVVPLSAFNGQITGATRLT